MTILTSDETDRTEVARAFGDGTRLVVVSLCAAWCDTCTQFRSTYARLADSRPEMAFVWLDIEDDAAIAGDIDVENFPTLAIYRGAQPVHFGICLPHETTVRRLIDDLAVSVSTLQDAPAPVAQLPDAFLKVP